MITSHNYAFQIKDLPPGRYFLGINNTGPLNFTDQKALYFVAKQNSYLIQTDKAIYKPEDLVRFRILSMDIDTMPLNPVGLSVVIQVKLVHFIEGC